MHARTLLRVTSRIAIFSTVVEALHHLLVLVLLVLVELGIKHVCSTRNLLVGVGPTALVLIERMLLELRLGGGLKVLPELELA